MGVANGIKRGTLENRLLRRAQGVTFTLAPAKLSSPPTRSTCSIRRSVESSDVKDSRPFERLRVHVTLRQPARQIDPLRVRTNRSWAASLQVLLPQAGHPAPR